jgi:hypothetical protein
MSGGLVVKLPQALRNEEFGTEAEPGEDQAEG